MSTDRPLFDDPLPLEREQHIRAAVTAALDPDTVCARAARARGGGGIPDHVHQRAALLTEIDRLRALLEPEPEAT